MRKTTQKYPLLFRFRNAFLAFGSRTKADALFLEFMLHLKSLVKKSPYFVLQEALLNVRPSFELRSKKVAASKYSVPALLTEDRADSYAIRSMIKCAKQRSEKTLPQRIACEVVDAYHFTGQTYKQLVQLNEEVSKNRPFVRFFRRR